MSDFKSMSWLLPNQDTFSYSDYCPHYHTIPVISPLYRTLLDFSCFKHFPVTLKRNIKCIHIKIT